MIQIQQHLSRLKPEAVVVNDDPTQLLLLSELVRHAGLEPLPFGDAESALATMTPEHLPALIVTDLYMPGIDGWRFCRLLRSPEYLPFNAVPILVVSATFAGEEPDRIASDLGAEAFLPAPVDGPRLLEQIRAIREGQQLRRQPRVLIADDQRDLCELLQQALQAHGYTVDVAFTVRTAAEAFASKPYDLAVIDYHLPDGTGDALLEAFSAQRPDCVCVMMTSDPGPALALEWMKRGAAAYLRKPFAAEYLVELCSRVRRERHLLRAQDLLELRTSQLRESEENYRVLVENALETILVIQNEEVVFANSRTAQFIDCPLDSTLSRSFLDFVHPDDRALVRDRHHQRLLGMKVPPRYEFRMVSAQGRHLWVEINVVLIEWRGAPASLSFLSDITERKQAEEEREQLQAQLNQAQKMESVGRLAGGVAHDFNNMLGVILGYTRLALDRMDPSEPLFTDLQEVSKAAERSSDLTRQLLAFARRQTISPKVLDLNATVEGMLKMLRRLIGEDIELTWLPGKGLWPIRFDAAQIDQILANLSVNARDAIAGVGQITIETRNVSRLDPRDPEQPKLLLGEYVLLAVTDTGCGIEPETLGHLFEPFFTTKALGQGTGLGLSTVYGIVKQNNGFIDVDSTPAKGSTFRIFLPRHHAPCESIPVTTFEPPIARGHGTVLVVEDEASLLQLTARVLTHLGYTVLTAPSPQQAMQLADQHPDDIDLLITDVVMPVMNGRDLAHQLTIRHPNLQRLFMSGYTADVIAPHGVLDPGVQFIEKPFSPRQLADRVREVLNGVSNRADE